MKVHYSKSAVADLIAIADYIVEHNPRAAEEVEKRIRASIGQLETFPFSDDRRTIPISVCFRSFAILTSYSTKWRMVRS
jgi:plasmid stabilization system protein ParE